MSEDQAQWFLDLTREKKPGAKEMCRAATPPEARAPEDSDEDRQEPPNLGSARPQAEETPREEVAQESVPLTAAPEIIAEAAEQFFELEDAQEEARA